MRLVTTYHAVLRYAERVLGHNPARPRDMAHATASLVAEFQEFEVTHTSRDGSKIVVAPSGVHAAITKNNYFRTVFTPGQAVDNCWCPECVVARAPHTKRTKPTKAKRRQLRTEES